MTLIPEPATPGLWRNPDWKPGTPGTFAVVIGVSVYDHLTGGSMPVNQPFGLSQLYVSAITAYRFWQWLRDRYRYDSSPLAQCWLLVAPTLTELAIEPDLTTHALRPTYHGCETAIGQWFTAMKGLSLESQARSRAIVFWSGHGLEVRRDKQLLLPSDYLMPPLENPNHTLSTYNLYTGAAALAVPEQFFFVDACRNDHPQLRELDLQGTAILREVPAAHSNLNLIAPILYASASGAQGWQPRDPHNGLSIFGQALLEGLQAEGDIKLECSADACGVNVFALEHFLTRRVSALLRRHNRDVKHPVAMGGAPNDATITQLPLRPVIPAPQPLSTYCETRSGQMLDMALAAQDAQAIPLDDTIVTTLRGAILLYDLRDCRRLNAAALTVYAATRADDGAYHLLVSLPTVHPCWLQVVSGTDVHAVLLGGDPTTTRYDLRFLRGNDNEVHHLQASLSESSPDRAGAAARLWETYIDSGLGAALGQADMDHSGDLGSSPGESPLATAIATLILLRARRFDLLPVAANDRLTQLPTLPDTIVLRAEQQLQESSELRPAVAMLQTLTSQGMPVIGAVLGLAARQTNTLLTAAFEPEAQMSIVAIDRWLRTALRFFVPGGLFAAFTGPMEELQPGLVLPPMDLAPLAVPNGYTVSPRRFTMDIAKLVPALVTLLSPLLPQLVKAGQSATNAVGKKAGEATWEQGTRIWQKLKPAIDADPGTTHAAQRLAANPQSPDNQAAFRVELTDLLCANPALVPELQALFAEAQNAGAPFSVDHSVVGSGTVITVNGSTVNGSVVGRNSSTNTNTWNAPVARTTSPTALDDI